MKASLLRILALIHKELLIILKDPRGRMMLAIPPVIQALVFGYAATFDLNKVPYAVLDHDRTQTSRALIARLDGSHTFKQVASLQRTSDIASFINSREVMFVLVIHSSFEKEMTGGLPTNIQIILDGRNSNTAGIIQGYINSIIPAFHIQWLQEHSMELPAETVSMTTRSWYNPQLETRWYMIPSMISVITLLMIIMLTGMSVSRERETGTFDQLLVAPFRPFEIMTGKAVPSMIVGLFQASIILLVAVFWFHIPFSGSLLIFYLGLTLFVLASVGVGLFISSIAVSMQQSVTFSFIVIIPFIMLSGLMSPIANMPEILQYFTFINPLRYAISMIQQIYLEGADIRQLYPQMLALILISLITLPVAAWMFRNRLT